MMKCLTQRPTCRNFDQQQSELCKYCTPFCSRLQDFTTFFPSFYSETELTSHFPNISSQIQDPLVLLDPVCLRETLLEWLPVLERILGPVEPGSTAADDSNVDGPGEERWERDYLNSCSEQHEASSCSSGEPTESITEEKKEESPELGEKEDQCDSTEKEPDVSNGSPPEPVRVESPKPIPSDLLANLTQLAALYMELICFRNQENEQALGCTTFLRRYFFLLDQERMRRMCLLCYQEQPEVQSSFTEAMLGQKLLLKLLDHRRPTLV